MSEIDIASIPQTTWFPTPALYDSHRERLVIDDSTLARISQRLEDEYAAMIANGGKIIWPHLIAGRWPLQTLPKTRGMTRDVLESQFETLDLSDAPVFSDAMDEAYYEAMRHPHGAIIAIYGIVPVARCFFLPPGGSLVGLGWQHSHLVWAGGHDELFFSSGDYYTRETAVPIASTGIERVVETASGGLRYDDHPTLEHAQAAPLGPGESVRGYNTRVALAGSGAFFRDPQLDPPADGKRLPEGAAITRWPDNPDWWGQKDARPLSNPLASSPWRAATFDVRAQGLLQYSHVGLRTATAASTPSDLTRAGEYTSAKVVDVDAAAMTLTLEGTGFVPALAQPAAFVAFGGGWTWRGEAFERDPTREHPRYRQNAVRKMSFIGRHDGNLFHYWFDGIKGTKDPEWNFERNRYARILRLHRHIDSDSMMEAEHHYSTGGNRTHDAPAPNPRLSSVDCSWPGGECSGGQREAVFIDSMMSNSQFHEKWKFYYPGQSLRDSSHARSIVFEPNVDGLHVLGQCIVEDSAGHAIEFGDQCRNIHFAHFEWNNGNAMGLGAPGTVGPCPFVLDAYLVHIPRNNTVMDVSLKGQIRAAEGNRDGFHCNGILKIGRDNQLVGPSLAADAGAGPAFLARMHLDLIATTAGKTLEPMHKRRAPAHRIFRTGEGAARGEIVRTEATDEAVRYEALLDIDPSWTVPAPVLATTNGVHWGAGPHYLDGSGDHGPSKPALPFDSARSYLAHEPCTFGGAVYRALGDVAAHGADPAASPDWERVDFGRTRSYFRPVGGMRNAWKGAFSIEEAADERHKREFCDVTVHFMGERDPSYHRRTLDYRTAYTVDPQHDEVTLDMAHAAIDTRLDAFRGADGKEQIFRAVNNLGAGNLVIEPGWRNRDRHPVPLADVPGQPLGQFEHGHVAGVYARITCEPWAEGGRLVLSREGSQCRTVWKDGKLWPMPHAQTEALPAGDHRLDVSDWGKTLVVHTADGATSTLAMPDEATLPDGWYVHLVNGGTGILDASAFAGGPAAMGPYERASVPVAHGAAASAPVAPEPVAAAVTDTYDATVNVTVDASGALAWRNLAGENAFVTEGPGLDPILAADHVAVLDRRLVMKGYAPAQPSMALTIRGELTSLERNPVILAGIRGGTALIKLQVRQNGGIWLTHDSGTTRAEARSASTGLVAAGVPFTIAFVYDEVLRRTVCYLDGLPVNGCIVEGDLFSPIVLDELSIGFWLTFTDPAHQLRVREATVWGGAPTPEQMRLAAEGTV